MKLLWTLVAFLLVSCQFDPLSRVLPEPTTEQMLQAEQLPTLTFRSLLENPPGEEFGTVRGLLEVRTTSGGLTPSGPVLQAAAATLAIRGRSSGNWPKHSFSLELRDPTAPTTTVGLPLVGLPKENDFVLHALWSDKSMARNQLAYSLAAELQAWAPRTRYVEVWGSQLSGDLAPTYQGIYLLVEKIKADKNRVNIELPSAFDESEPNISGGYLFQIDWPDDDTWFPNTKTINLVVKQPRASVLNQAQRDYLLGWLTDLEASLRSTPVGPWRDYLDETTFIDFLLLNEITKNVDGYRLSTYLHKPRGGKLRAGPVWDFDLGMANDGRSYDPAGWVLLQQLHPDFNDQFPAFWWNEMLHDASFRAAVRARWMQLRSTTFRTDHLLSVINRVVNEVAPAVQRNFQRWPSLTSNEDVWWTPLPLYGLPVETFPTALYTYEHHVASFRQWLTDRVAWLDSEAAWTALDEWANTMPLHINQLDDPGSNL